MAEPVDDGDDVLLRVEGLRTHIDSEAGVVKAVNGVSFTIRKGEIVGLVGESGSGKSMTCMSTMGLMPVEAAKIVDGEVWFEGRNLVTLSDKELRRLRGSRMAMIMQDPLTALNPVIKIGDQVGEALEYHTSQSKASRLERVIQVLSDVRIPRPEDRLDQYPHHFSGGMRQRIVAAMGLSTAPALMIADEPTTALDVTIQAQFLAVIKDMQEETGMAVLWVTHDLGVVAQLCDRVNVMYAGRIVESADVKQIFSAPQHPYTKGLLDSVPVVGRHQERLYEIEGSPPSLVDMPVGCPFYDRCPVRMDICKEEYPEATPTGDGNYVHCWAVE